MTGRSAFHEYAFISLGANLPSAIGKPEQALAFAFDKLGALSAKAVLKSSLYATAPLDSPPDTPDFLNAVAGIVPPPGENALTLLHKLQAIENEAGRQRSGIPNEARTLDLDLICFRNEIVETAELVLPHPKAHERLFVLQPLVEIVGEEFVLPGHRRTLKDSLERVSGQDITRL